MTAFQNPSSGAILSVTGKVKLTTSLEKNELSLKAVKQFQMQASLPGEKLETDMLFPRCSVAGALLSFLFRDTLAPFWGWVCSKDTPR